MERKRKVFTRQRQEDIIRVSSEIHEMILRGEIDKCDIVEKTAKLLNISARTVKK